MAGSLEFGKDGRGWRHYLEGEPVRIGERLEILLPDGSWSRGRYDWPYRSLGRQPEIYVGLGEHGRWVPIRDDDLLRWGDREADEEEERAIPYDEDGNILRWRHALG